MFRLTLFLLATAPILAQNNCSPSCSKMEFAPISGRVLNAATDQPIAGARIHYRGNGGSFGGDDLHELDPITLQGEVTTAADGSYTLPALPPGTFSVRASAPGFLAAKDHLQPLPVGFKPLPHPVPPGYKGPPPHLADGVFKLNPNTLDLHPLSDVALTIFALPMKSYSERRYLTAAFNPDGDHLAFLTQDFISSGPVQLPFFSRCAAWNYDLKDGILTVPPQLPPGACETSGPIVWDGDIFYTALPPDPGSSPSAWIARVQGQHALPWGVMLMSKPAQERLARETAAKTIGTAITTDRRFSIKEDDSGVDGRGACGKLVALSTNPPRTQIIAQKCTGFTSLLDRDRNIVLYTQPTRTQYPDKVENIIEYDLNTTTKRIFTIPVMNYEPKLLTEQSLPNGAIRVAYTIEGDCDHNASDYSEPGQPDGQLGNTPNQFSVCFITIPPPQAPATQPHQ
jgi:hypothetical protein